MFHGFFTFVNKEPLWNIKNLFHGCKLLIKSLQIPIDRIVNFQKMWKIFKNLILKISRGIKCEKLLSNPIFFVEHWQFLCFTLPVLVFVNKSNHKLLIILNFLKCDVKTQFVDYGENVKKKQINLTTVSCFESLV